MVKGTYDGYIRRVLVDSEVTLRDGERCLIVPDHPYFQAQLQLIQVLAQDYDGNIGEAIDEFISGHAERFNSLWKKHPEKREKMLEFYFQNLEESGMYNQT